MRGVQRALLWLALTPTALAQSPARRGPDGDDNKALATCTQVPFQGATQREEALLCEALRIIEPRVLPTRIVFVPHWKYIDTARTFRLHVPTGFTSAMFTHLPSRTIFIDADRYVSDDSLGYWLAHELGHLATNSPKENDAERVAHEYRKRIRDAKTVRITLQKN